MTVSDRMASQGIDGAYKARCESMLAAPLRHPHVKSGRVDCTEAHVCSRCDLGWEVLTASWAGAPSYRQDEHTVEGEPRAARRPSPSSASSADSDAGRGCGGNSMSILDPTLADQVARTGVPLSADLAQSAADRAKAPWGRPEDGRPLLRWAPTGPTSPSWWTSTGHPQPARRRQPGQRVPDRTAVTEQHLLHLVDRARRGVILPAELDDLHGGIVTLGTRLKQAEKAAPPRACPTCDSDDASGRLYGDCTTTVRRLPAPVRR
ncbi:hypothetical protein OHB41_42885 [Streptomyces sp. NBC_01571]|uniref:hypothetical protein n=1 Tax=Streptomyces sp. NBC_01571 TaxID=2975883 RepID=UPI00225AD171|nr:hypothetical protein [Streptomyces sp. NBC_01571]MCX4579808.1 hypothetical protein [Streptomyces sp. NBC_01571]